MPDILTKDELEMFERLYPEARLLGDLSSFSGFVERSVVEDMRRLLEGYRTLLRRYEALRDSGGSECSAHS